VGPLANGSGLGRQMSRRWTFSPAAVVVVLGF
jgi:hypothetical protein